MCARLQLGLRQDALGCLGSSSFSSVLGLSRRERLRRLSGVNGDTQLVFCSINHLEFLFLIPRGDNSCAAAQSVWSRYHPFFQFWSFIVNNVVNIVDV